MYRINSVICDSLNRDYPLVSDVFYSITRPKPDNIIT